MSNLKVLPLQPWMKDRVNPQSRSYAHLSTDYPEIPAKLNRDGYYLQRVSERNSVVWFEIAGKAFKSEQGDWNCAAEFTWDVLLTAAEADALATLVHLSSDRELVKVCRCRLRKHLEMKRLQLSWLRSKKRIKVLKKKLMEQR